VKELAERNEIFLFGSKNVLEGGGLVSEKKKNTTVN